MQSTMWTAVAVGLLSVVVAPSAQAQAADGPQQITVQHDPASPTGGIQEAVDAMIRAGREKGGVIYIPPGEYVLRKPIEITGGAFEKLTIRGAGPSTVLVAVADHLTRLRVDAAQGEQAIVVEDTAPLAVGDALFICDEATNPNNGTLAQITAIDEDGMVTLNVPLERNVLVADGAFASRSWPLVYGRFGDFRFGFVLSDMSVVGSLRNNFQGRAGWGQNSTIDLHGGYLRIERIDVRDAPADGIVIGGDGVCIVRDCTFDNIGQRGIHPGNNATRFRIVDNHIANVGQVGIYFCNGVQRSVITGNVITNIGSYRTDKGKVQRIDAFAEKVEPMTPERRRSYIMQNFAGIGGIGGGGNYDTHNVIANNSISHVAGSGIAFLKWNKDDPRPGKYNIVTGNNISDVQYAGIYLYTAEFCTVQNNLVSNADEGIAVHRSASCTVQNNMIQGAQIGINLYSELDDVLTERNIVTGNTIVDCAEAITEGDNVRSNVIENNHVQSSAE